MITDVNEVRNINKASKISTLWHWGQVRYIRLRVVHALGMPGTFFFRHRGLAIPTCITARVPWCMQGPLTSGFLFKSVEGKTFQALSAHVQPAILRICAAHMGKQSTVVSSCTFPFTSINPDDINELLAVFGLARLIMTTCFHLSNFKMKDAVCRSLYIG